LPKTAVPATSTVAPAEATRGAVSGVMPPSTSTRVFRPRRWIVSAMRSIFGRHASMKLWPPKPGLTVITSTMSVSSSA